MRFRILLMVLACVAAPFLVTPSHLTSAEPQRDGDAEAFAPLLERYRADLERPSLSVRTRSAGRLALSRDPRALEVLRKRYLEPPDEPVAEVRATTATICGAVFDEQRFVEPWQRWLSAAAADADAWLWWHGQRIRAAHGELAVVLDEIHGHDNVVLRATSLQALARAGRLEALDVLPEVMERLPRDPHEAAVLLRSAAVVLYELRDELGSERYTAAATPVIRQLQARRMSHDAKAVLDRVLRRIFNRETWRCAEAWLELLTEGVVPEEPDIQPRVLRDTRPYYDRVVYILDGSAAMSRSVDGETTYFDAGRRYLERILRHMPEATHVCVIVTGTHPRKLETTPRLVVAHSPNKRAIINELRELKVPTEETSQRSNLHGALRQAFRVTTDEPISAAEDVSRRGLTTGAGAIVVISGSAPNWDDFAAHDEPLPEGQESAQTPGPYARPLHAADSPIPHHFVADVQRMNLHRRAKITGIGMADSDAAVLEDLARTGFGRVRRYDDEALRGFLAEDSE